MKKAFGGLFIFFVVIFAFGYFPVKLAKPDKKKIYCEKIMTLPLWVLVTFANGDANACMDAGFLPRKASR